MPRHRRLLSEANVYHIVLKGINAQQLFFDKNDYQCFLRLFSGCCKTYNAKVIAYCLMNNHIHLLIKFESEDFSGLFKSFGASFVPWYNHKYKRSGPLFNGRFYSKPINDDEYLYAVIKYIHYNPIKAGLCSSLSEYKWSSYREYNENSFCIVDDSVLFTLMSKNDFDIIHISDDSDLINFFKIEYSFDRDTKKLNEFVQTMKNQGKDYSDIIQYCLNAGVSLRKISEAMEIGLRSLQKMNSK